MITGDTKFHGSKRWFEVTRRIKPNNRLLPITNKNLHGDAHIYAQEH